MYRARWLVPAVALSVVGATSFAAEEKGKEGAEKEALAKDVEAAKISLEKGLSASEAQGKPISAKFEIEEGTFQLSVYTVKAGNFYEVIVDHKTGKGAKKEPITSDADLTAAKVQNEATAKSKTSLRSAVGEALKANKGYRAVSVVPSVEGGQSTAAVTLVKGNDWKTVKEKLN